MKMLIVMKKVLDRRLINSDYWRGNTEAEALVAALEATPNTSGEHRRKGER